MKWKGDPRTSESHRHDYRWRKNKKDRIKWILKHYELTEEEEEELKK